MSWWKGLLSRVGLADSPERVPPVGPRSVLIVCTGNVCRSPMAEVLMREWLGSRGLQVRVESAGVGAPVGLPADVHAIDLMHERELDLLEHRARQVSAAMLAEFDLVLVMEYGQAAWLSRRYRRIRNRVWHLGYFDGGDIDDPVGRGEDEFRASLADIERGLASWYAQLWPASPRAGET